MAAPSVQDAGLTHDECALLIGLLAGPPAEAAPRPIRLLGEQIVPLNLPFEGTTVGGLSSIDYDPGEAASQLFFATV